MADSRKRDFADDHDGNTSDAPPIDARPEAASFVDNPAAESSRVESENESANVVVDGDGDRDGDLLLGEDMVLRWLQALDMQVMGACRADERLKPLLKLNVSNGMAENRLLAHLSQHFEPAEIGLLARCFCIPLVSIRVGKIKKEGTRMIPTPTRGNLSLMLLPTSDLRLSFIGDNGHSERLFTFRSEAQCSAVSVEDLCADSSGRSFGIRIPDGHSFYYWCSEKSKLLGIELRRKMKDLIRERPSVSELTGIDESRLRSVASHLHVYLMGSVVHNMKGCLTASSSTLFPDSSSSSGSRDSPSSSCPSKSLRARHCGSQPSKASAFHQGSLSPRSSSLKENTLRNSSSRISSRDKSRRRSDGLSSAFDNLHVASITTAEASVRTENETALDTRHVLLALERAEPLQKSTDLPRPELPLKVGPPIFSPYYCWCPPNASSLHSPTDAQPHPPFSMELSSLPPLSSLLPSSSGLDGILNSPPRLDLSEIPPLLPDSLPLVRLPISSSQQIPTFTPLMCDPIVHIPVIDVCSSGQGYLVSAGPGMPTSIPPLHSNLVNPVLPQNDSLLEKGARETLRLLISGSGNATSAAPLINVLAKSEDRHCIRRGLYDGTSDASGFSGVSLFAPLVLQPAVGVTATTSGGGGGRGVDDEVEVVEAGGVSGESIPPEESSD